MPVVDLFELSEVDDQDYIGPIPHWRHRLRQQRHGEVSEIPEAVAMALPGALAGQLPKSWPGFFRVGHYPNGARSRLSATLRKEEQTDTILAEISKNGAGSATLYTWISNVETKAVTKEGPPGDVVKTEVGPILINLHEEPIRVRADVGMALVAYDGEVLLRYTDNFESVVSGDRSSHRAGRDLAMALAKEIIPMWPTDPRLSPLGEPPEDHPIKE